MKLINCSKCNSLKIDKSIMAPRISSFINLIHTINPKMLEVKSKIKEFQGYIKKNFDYVGENFSYEARSIHYGSKKNKKPIWKTRLRKILKN